MAFVTKTWKDRLVEYAGRRKLKNVATGEEVLMDVSRSEGTVSQAGDDFSAANMNNLEQRIKNEFDTVNSSLQDQPTFEYDETGKITGYKTKIGGADTVFPFSSDMTFKVTARLRRRDGSGALSSTEKKIFYIYLKNGEFTWTSPQNIDGYQCILSCYGGWWNHFDIISIELV